MFKIEYHFDKPQGRLSYMYYFFYLKIDKFSSEFSYILILRKWK